MIDSAKVLRRMICFYLYLKRLTEKLHKNMPIQICYYRYVKSQ